MMAPLLNGERYPNNIGNIQGSADRVLPVIGARRVAGSRGRVMAREYGRQMVRLIRDANFDISEHRIAGSLTQRWDAGGTNSLTRQEDPPGLVECNIAKTTRDITSQGFGEARQVRGAQPAVFGRNGVGQFQHPLRRLPESGRRA